MSDLVQQFRDTPPGLKPCGFFRHARRLDAQEARMHVWDAVSSVACSDDWAAACEHIREAWLIEKKYGRDAFVGPIWEWVNRVAHERCGKKS